MSESLQEVFSEALHPPRQQEELVVHVHDPVRGELVQQVQVQDHASHNPHHTHHLAVAHNQVASPLEHSHVHESAQPLVNQEQPPPQALEREQEQAPQHSEGTLIESTEMAAAGAMKNELDQYKVAYSELKHQHETLQKLYQDNVSSLQKEVTDLEEKLAFLETASNNTTSADNENYNKTDTTPDVTSTTNALANYQRALALSETQKQELAQENTRLLQQISMLEQGRRDDANGATGQSKQNAMNGSTTEEGAGTERLNSVSGLDFDVDAEAAMGSRTATGGRTNHPDNYLIPTNNPIANISDGTIFTTNQKPRLQQQQTEQKIPFRSSLSQDDAWQVKYNLLIQYKTKHGHCQVPYNYASDLSLAKWVHRQRSIHRSEKGMKKERREKLERLGFFLEMGSPNSSCCNSIGTTVDTNVVNGGEIEAVTEVSDATAATTIGNSVGDESYTMTTVEAEALVDSTTKTIQQHQMEASASSQQQAHIQTQTRSDEKWEDHFVRLTEYKNKHGDCLVPTNTELGRWLCRQRHNHKYKGLKKDRRIRLEQLDESCLGQRVIDLVGADTVPSTNITNEGPSVSLLSSSPLNENEEKGRRKEKDSDDNKNESSVKEPAQSRPSQYELFSTSPQSPSNKQYHAKTKYNQAYETKLHAKWNAHFQELVKYKNKHNHCNFPTMKGRLGRWISRQRTLFRNNKLKSDRYTRLINLGFEFEDAMALEFKSKLDEQWKIMYKELEIHRKRTGHCFDVPETLPLGKWLYRQRWLYRHGNLRKDRAEKLLQIGFEDRKLLKKDLACKVENQINQQLHQHHQSQQEANKEVLREQKQEKKENNLNREEEDQQPDQLLLQQQDESQRGGEQRYKEEGDKLQPQMQEQGQKQQVEELQCSSVQRTKSDIEDEERTADSTSIAPTSSQQERKSKGGNVEQLVNGTDAVAKAGANLFLADIQLDENKNRAKFEIISEPTIGESTAKALEGTFSQCNAVDNSNQTEKIIEQKELNNAGIQSVQYPVVEQMNVKQT